MRIMKNQSLFLIFTPIDHLYKDADTHYAPSLGLVALKNFLARALPTLNVVILDGSVCYTTEDIVQIISSNRPDYVGQSIQLISYKNNLKIAAAAKAVGAKTIVGGHQATQMRKEIAINQENLIDFVVFGDGEMALCDLIRRRDLREISNLAYCRNGVYIENSFQNIPFSEIPATDYSDIDLAPYQTLLRSSRFNTSFSDTYLRVYSHKGCGNRGGSEACVFCGRADVNVRFKTPGQYWMDIKNVVERNGADYIFDVGDDFIASRHWLEKVVALKPDISTSYDMGIFGRANRVTEDKARLLKSLNVKDVVIGFETGDPDIMANIGKKRTTVTTSVQAAEYLFQNDIDVCASFVLGLPGESERSLESTIEVAGRIVELSLELRGVKPRELVANLLEPSPGSPAFRAIVERFPEKYKGRDVLDLQELQYDYFRVYFDITNVAQYDAFRNRLRTAANTIHSLVDFADSQGWLHGEVNAVMEHSL